jgi:hypothetical protein
MAKSDKVLIKTGRRKTPDADFIDLEMPNILKEYGIKEFKSKVA